MKKIYCPGSYAHLGFALLVLTASRAAAQTGTPDANIITLLALNQPLAAPG